MEGHDQYGDWFTIGSGVNPDIRLFLTSLLPIMSRNLTKCLLNDANTDPTPCMLNLIDSSEPVIIYLKTHPHGYYGLRMLN